MQAQDGLVDGAVRIAVEVAGAQEVGDQHDGVGVDEEASQRAAFRINILREPFLHALAPLSLVSRRHWCLPAHIGSVLLAQVHQISCGRGCMVAGMGGDRVIAFRPCGPGRLGTPGTAQQRVFMLSFEPAAEKGGGHALALAVVLPVVNVLPRRIGLAEQREQRVVQVLLGDAAQGEVGRDLQDVRQLERRLLNALLRAGAAGARGREADHVGARLTFSVPFRSLLVPVPLLLPLQAAFLWEMLVLPGIPRKRAEAGAQESAKALVC
ncbi:MAG TPA: hypothetical protein VKR06_36445 [Ktedonosporobacter sp.]|nr:hypothetical protein [Ktedonosporobacter sp.]